MENIWISKKIDWINQSFNADKKLILSLDIKRDFLNKLDSISFEKFRNQFFDAVKENTEIKKDKINPEFIEEYFNKKILNPKDKINNLRKEYFWEFIDINWNYNVKIWKHEEVSKETLNNIQNSIINMFNTLEFNPIKVFYNWSTYSFELKNSFLWDRLYISQKENNLEIKINYLEINFKDKTLDNILNITKSIRNNFFHDLHLWNEEEILKNVKENNKNILYYFWEIISYSEMKKNYEKINNEFTALINAEFYENYWEYLWLKTNLINNPIFIEENKIILDISDWYINSWFKIFDSVTELITHLKDIDKPNNQDVKNKNKKIVEDYLKNS